MNKFESLIEKLKEEYEGECSRSQLLRKQLEEYNKDEEIQKREARIKQLYTNSLMIMSDEEVRQEQKFIRRHYELHNGERFKAIGDTYIYTLTGTGIGTIIKIKCPICGEEKDITDINSW